MSKLLFNDFLDNVRTGNVSDIERENYIYKISKKHQPDKLETILKDIEFYLFVERSEIESEITQKDWDNLFSRYQKKGETVPLKRVINPLKNIINKKNNLSTEPEFLEYYDLEKLFYPHEFFCIYQLKNYIKSLISPKQKQTKHENIFSNNGFILFEHILNNYVKSGRGRKSDIAFFYWEMFNDKNHFIHQRPETFKNWFFSTYDNEDLGKLKTYDMVKNPNRLRDYSTALEWFKTHKNNVP